LNLFRGKVVTNAFKEESQKRKIKGEKLDWNCPTGLTTEEKTASPKKKKKKSICLQKKKKTLIQTKPRINEFWGSSHDNGECKKPEGSKESFQGNRQNGKGIRQGGDKTCQKEFD